VLSPARDAMIPKANANRLRTGIATAVELALMITAQNSGYRDGMFASRQSPLLCG